MPDRYGDPIELDNDRGEPEDVLDIATISIDDCDLCDDNGYRHGIVCDHIDRTHTYRAGMNAVREALTKKGTDNG